MQKPQQRKYHSSCNRSVHRGTAHGKQRVKVCKRKTPHLLMRSFLSPYGDGTWNVRDQTEETLFSPPYGDGTDVRWFLQLRSCFRPLTGMILSRSRPRMTRTRFRPLTGMVRILKALLFCSVGFRPLTGMVRTRRTRRTLRKCFRPLTGMVPSGMLRTCPCGSFRPLTGIVPMKHSAIRKRGRFRPLAGISCSDYEENHRERGKPSPPLRGLYQEPRNSGREAGAIAPLRGWYCVVFNTYI